MRHETQSQLLILFSVQSTIDPLRKVPFNPFTAVYFVTPIKPDRHETGACTPH